VGGRGVFLGIKNTLVSVEEPTLDTDAELKWAKINLLNSAPLYICSYYRPPYSDLQPILELNESMDKLARKHPNCNFIVASFGGNFNLPIWIDGLGSIFPNLTYSHNLNEVFIDVINNHNFRTNCQFTNYTKPHA